MATIKSLGLQIQPTGNPSLHRVTVSFKLSFDPPDYGKRFRYSIKLSGTDAGENSTPVPSHLRYYQFDLGDGKYRRVTGGQIVQNIYSHTADVPREYLDEDRDVTFDNPHPGPDVHLVFPDEIVATVLLERGPVGPFVVFADRKVSPVKTFTA